jgi:putative membrane protein
MQESPPHPPPNDAFWLKIIFILSAVICAAVAFLFWGPRPEALQGRLDVSALPKVNAGLNVVTTVLLIIGLILVKNRKLAAHQMAMISAFACSTAFLVSYVVYHSFKAAHAEYLGAYRGLYLSILVSHIVLAVAILPLALTTLYWGRSGQLQKHKKIARITFPIWLYVSSTGVIIYFMLY